MSRESVSWHLSRGKTAGGKTPPAGGRKEDDHVEWSFVGPSQDGEEVPAWPGGLGRWCAGARPTGARGAGSFGWWAGPAQGVGL